MASLSPTSTDTSVPSSTKPTQIKFLRAVQMALFARVITYPPLGQVTVVPPSRKQFNFTVVVESSQSLPDPPWEVSIWYDHGSYSHTHAPWKALDLEKSATPPTILLDGRSDNVYRHTFEGSLPSPFPDNAKTYRGRKISFTVRYRINETSEWQWVGDNFGVGDGNVILQPPLDPNFLGAGPVELRDGWHARKLQSEAPGARLYIAESSSPISTNPEGESRQDCKTLGHIISPCRWFALVRIWSPWLAPRHGKEFFRLDKPAVLLSFLRSDGQHVVLLAINGIDECLTTFSSDDHGHIVCCARNDTGRERKFRILAAIAWSFEVANASVMYEMRKMVVQSSAYQETLQSLGDLNLNLKDESVDSDTVLISNNEGDQTKSDVNESAPTPQWIQSWYDTLAYCTWNSLGQDLTLEKIMKGLKSLADNDIQVASLIIDDNWQSLSGTQGETDQFQRGWTAFEAHRAGFPDGLKAAVDKIRQTYPQIRDVAVWHALFGYWGCISPDQGHIKDDYKIRELPISLDVIPETTKHIVDPSDIHRMYDDFYSFLSQCGITAVKTDAQFFLDSPANTKDRQEITFSYQSAWTQAHLKHLSGKAISCMSLVPQILYHQFLPTNLPQVMLRNSDDFFPDVEESHPWHVFSNAHTACFTQHLNVLPDWDMFQTAHPWSGFHAAARCVSGGPIYITDTPGEHNIDLIHQMTAKNPRGETVVLRPSTIGKSTGVYDSYEEGSPVKVGSYDGRSEVGTGLMGLFNIWKAERAFIVPINKIPGVEAVEIGEGLESNERLAGKRWVVRSHFSRRITKPITPTIPPRGDSLLELTLPARGYDIWSALPVHGPFNLGTGPAEFAVVGLLGKMTGACAIVASSFTEVPSHQLKIHVQLKALGILGIWVSNGATRETDDMMVILNDEAIPQERVRFSVESTRGDDTGLLEVDVAGAWDDLKLESGWSNEVGIDIFFP